MLKLCPYILSREPGIRGYSSQNIWRMKQFYETYKDRPELSTLLRENTWSNNMHIISKTKSYEEKEFYLKLASKEKYKAKELASTRLTVDITSVCFYQMVRLHQRLKSRVNDWCASRYVYVGISRSSRAL